MEVPEAVDVAEEEDVLEAVAEAEAVVLDVDVANAVENDVELDVTDVLAVALDKAVLETVADCVGTGTQEGMIPPNQAQLPSEAILARVAVGPIKSEAQLKM